MKTPIELIADAVAQIEAVDPSLIESRHNYGLGVVCTLFHLELLTVEEWLAAHDQLATAADARITAAMEVPHV